MDGLRQDIAIMESQQATSAHQRYAPAHEWGAIQPDAHDIIIRPTNMTGNEGGAYVIPRTAIEQPYRSTSSTGRKI